jgi:hypothetical protein
MLSESFYEAALPEPFTILGLRLRPLSMGHLIILHRIGSPFVVDTEELTGLGDLAVACLICSKTYQEGQELISDPDLPGALYRWGRRLTKPHWWNRRREIDLAEKFGLFADYIKAATEIPDHYWTQEGGSVDAPMVQTVKVQLLMKTSLTETELLDRPWRLCLWDMLTIRALEGQLRFVDGDKLVEAQARADAFAEQIKAREGNGG